MKNIFFTVFAVLLLLGMISCNHEECNDSKIALETEIDSFSYALGMDLGNNLIAKKVDELINKKAIVKGLLDAINKKELEVKQQQARQLISVTFRKIQKEITEKEFGENRELGAKFLEENKNKEGVITTTSGLQYIIMRDGTGQKPTVNDKVKVHYHGTLIDGTVFDSSVDRGEPVTFPVNGVIKAWVEALQLMPVGSKFKLFIPQELAYGERQAGQIIKPFSALVFEVELLEIETTK